MSRDCLSNFQKVATTAAAVIAIVGAVSGLSAWGASAIIQLKRNAASACIAERQVDLLSAQLEAAAIYSKYLDRRVRILRVRLDDIGESTPANMDAYSRGLQLYLQSEALLKEVNLLNEKKIPRLAKAVEQCERYTQDGTWGL